MASAQLNSAPRRPHLLVDAVVLLGLVSLVFGVSHVVGEWRQPLRPNMEIDLSPWSLPKYALFSFARGWIAYFLSLIFALVVASWAFYDTRAQRFILPALDVLQSLPVLSFLPGLVLALVSVFPHSNTGLELACVLMIFTGQVWNMTFSYYDSLKGMPPDFRALGRLYDFSWWRRFWKVELPVGAQGLVYNSMVSMAGGWFFLSVTEAFQLGDQDFRVPGIGSYMSVAHERNDFVAQFFGVVAMGVVIITVDRLVWWPLVLWSKRFNLDDFAGASVPKSSVGLWLARSATMQRIGVVVGRLWDGMVRPSHAPHRAPSSTQSVAPKTGKGIGYWVYRLILLLITGTVALGLVQLARLLVQVTLAEWRTVLADAGISFGRVLLAVTLGTLWTVPAGVWIGLNPRLSSKLQPFIQFAASFPAPMVYPWILALFLHFSATPLEWGAIPLIMLGTQWYILFNVASAASAIPNDIRSCAEILRLSGWRRWSRYLLPAIAPGLVTGWITAAGGAWNASIVAEYVQDDGKLYQATGLGALISQATAAKNFPVLTAASIVMALIVVGINRTVWKKLQSLANERCRFGT
jgi:NitT/TauT family transport system permease protein